MTQTAKIYKANVISKDGYTERQEIVSNSFENAQKTFESNNPARKVKMLKQTRKNIYS